MKKTLIVCVAIVALAAISALAKSNAGYPPRLDGAIDQVRLDTVALARSQSWQVTSRFTCGTTPQDIHAGLSPAQIKAGLWRYDTVHCTQAGDVGYTSSEAISREPVTLESAWLHTADGPPYAPNMHYRAQIQCVAAADVEVTCILAGGYR